MLSSGSTAATVNVIVDSFRSAEYWQREAILRCEARISEGRDLFIKNRDQIVVFYRETEYSRVAVMRLCIDFHKDNVNPSLEGHAN